MRGLGAVPVVKDQGMSEALESISPRPVGPLTPSAPAAGPDGVGGDGRGRERSPFVPASRAGWNDGQEGGPAGLADSLNLSPEAQQQLRELKLRDAEVRAHESAHLAAGGAHVNGGAGYTYQKGPDGRQYAIGGHVSIDSSSVPGDPEATREKAQEVRRAALAPGEPSGQDRQVAARAAAQEVRAARDARKEEDDGEGPAASGLVAAVDEPASAGRTVAADAAVSADATDAARGSTLTGAAALTGADTIDPAARRRAAGAYADMSMRGVMPTALAPGGMGVSLQV